MGTEFFFWVYYPFKSRKCVTDISPEKKSLRSHN